MSGYFFQTLTKNILTSVLKYFDYINYKLLANHIPFVASNQNSTFSQTSQNANPSYGTSSMNQIQTRPTCGLSQTNQDLIGTRGFSNVQNNFVVEHKCDHPGNNFFKIKNFYLFSSFNKKRFALYKLWFVRCY